MLQIVNDIRGDVLLALDINNLKSDVGIESFGTRYAIMEAVKKLRSEGECEWLVEPNIADFFIPVTLSDKHDSKQPRLEHSGLAENYDGSERHTVDYWLVELHSKLWTCGNLRHKLFRKTNITVEDYHALQQDLSKLYPDRDTANYISNNVLSTKLQFLQSRESTTSSLSRQPPHSHTELGETDDVGQSEDIDAELSSFLPATVEFLDLTPLQLLHPPPRLPLPLFRRHEYEIISEIITERGSGSGGSVLISGQPGTGEIHVLWYLFKSNRARNSKERLF
jgi:hypothetical protein